MYIGYGSEYDLIRQKSPHLDFDIAEVPQVSPTSGGLTYGQMGVLVISRKSEITRKNSALVLISVLTDPLWRDTVGEILNAAPTTRQALSVPPDNAVDSVIYNSAIKMRSWLGPDPEKVKEVFENMVKSVASGKKDTATAIRDSDRVMQSFIDQLNIN